MLVSVLMFRHSSATWVHKMASRGLVWPWNFLVKKQKLLIFVNHSRNAKVGACEIKNWQVRASFNFLAFWPLLNRQSRVEIFEHRVQNSQLFFKFFYLSTNFKIPKAPLIKKKPNHLLCLR